MKLEDYRQRFYAYSGKASDVNRQIAFAAIALIWLFKKDVGGQPTLPEELILPGAFIVASLTLDILQYCVAAIIWRCFYRSKENARVKETTELSHSVWHERPITTLFIAKIVCTFVAYFSIAKFFINVLLRQHS